MSRPNPFSRAAGGVAIALLLAVAAPAVAKPWASSKPVPSKPVSLPNPEPLPALEVYAVEDQAAEIDFGGPSAGIVLADAPTHGNLLTDRAPMVYVPHPDFNGLDAFTVLHDGAKRDVLVKVRAVNDAPRFSAGGDRAHAAGAPLAVEVEEWARAIDAGAADESTAQRVRFEVEPWMDGNGSVEGVDIDARGTLRYKLSGRAGTALFRVRAIDDGGTEDGGVAVSAPAVLRIGVDETADLGVQFLRGPGLGLPGRSAYQIVVSNKGPGTALAARLVEVLPPDAGTPAWRCAATGAAACPKIAFGHGALDLQVDLPADSLLVFSVTGMEAKPGTGLHAVFIAPPGHVVDPELSNNEAID